MSETDLLRTFYESFSHGGWEATLELCDPMVEVRLPPNVVSQISPRGRESVEKYLRGWLETWDEYHPIPEHFIDASDGEHVVVFVRVHARGKGSRFAMDEEVADVFAVRDGRISELRLYMEREKALALVGS